MYLYVCIYLYVYLYLCIYVHRGWAAAEGDEMAAMSRVLKSSKPSKVMYNARRDGVKERAEAGTGAATGQSGAASTAKRDRKRDKYADRARATTGTQAL